MQLTKRNRPRCRSMSLAAITLVAAFAQTTHAENSFPLDGEEIEWDAIKWPEMQNAVMHFAPWQCEHCKSKQSLFVFGAYVDVHYTKSRSGKRRSRRSAVAGIVTDADLRSLPTAEELFFRRDGTRVVEVDSLKPRNGLQSVPNSSHPNRKIWNKPWRRDDEGVHLHHAKWSKNPFVISAPCTCSRCGQKAAPIKLFAGEMSKVWMTWTRGEYAGITDWATLTSMCTSLFFESDRENIPDPLDVWRAPDAVDQVVLVTDGRPHPIDKIRSNVERLKDKE